MSKKYRAYARDVIKKLNLKLKHLQRFYPYWVKEELNIYLFTTFQPNSVLRFDMDVLKPEHFEFLSYGVA